ncbi:MAG: DUF6455 family protein [Pseudomonadota bacterium]
MSGLVKSVQLWLKQQQDADFLRSLPSYGWADLGGEKGDLMQIASGHSCVRERMRAMAAAYGLEPSDLSKDHWREVDMARACATCPSTRACKRWLKGPNFELADAGFCPNKAHFCELSGTDLDALEAEEDAAAAKREERLHYL